jgi:Anti-sigma factor NepR
MRNHQSGLYRQDFHHGPTIVNQERDNDKQAELGDNGVISGAKKGQLATNHAESEGAIGAGLRSLYQEVVKEPLPDDIMALLDKLGSLDTDDA